MSSRPDEGEELGLELKKNVTNFTVIQTGKLWGSHQLSKAKVRAFVISENTVNGLHLGGGRTSFGFRVRVLDLRKRAVKSQVAEIKPKQNAGNWDKRHEGSADQVAQHPVQWSSGRWEQGPIGQRGQWEPVVSGSLQHWVMGQWIWIKRPQIKGLMFLQWFSQSRLKVFSFGKLQGRDEGKRVRFGTPSTLTLNGKHTGFAVKANCDQTLALLLIPWDLGQIVSSIVKAA